MSDSLFNTPEVEVTTSEPEADHSVDALATQLFRIKNEKGGPKYDSVAKAIDALAHAQDYIPRLKSEKEQYEAELVKLREELAKRESLEDTIARLTTQRQTETPAPTSEVVKGLDENAVAQILQRELTQREQATIAQSNSKLVTETLVAKFGDKAKAVVAEKAQELGLSLQEMESLSQRTPKAFLAWFNPLAPLTSSAPIRSSVHLPEVNPQDLKRPEKSLLRGASTKDQIEFMRKIKAEIYKKHDIDS